jgi:hypothetical protein
MDIELRDAVAALRDELLAATASAMSCTHNAVVWQRYSVCGEITSATGGC